MTAILGPETRPEADWADALNRLSRAWWNGSLPGYLFNGTRARHLPEISLRGFLGSDGFAWCKDSDRQERQGKMVHLGTPDIAAWYMHDTEIESKELPGLVVVDIEGWMASRFRPTALMVDANSYFFPVFDALGANNADDVQSMMAPCENNWEIGLAITGAIAVDASYVPPTFLTCIGSPAELDAFMSRVDFPRIGGPIHQGIMRSCAANPWMATGWWFDAHTLGKSAIAHTL